MKILLGFSVVILLLSSSTILVIARIQALEREMNYITNHDMQVHELANQIEKNVIDMETGQRGFVITGDAKYLEPYNNGQKQWKEHFETLYRLVEDNLKQQEKLTETRKSVEQWVSIAGEPLIQLRKDNNMKEILRFFQEDPGKKNMDAIREQLASFKETEKELTGQRTSRLAAHNRALKLELYGLLAIAVLLAVGIAGAVSGTITRNVKQVVRTIMEIASSGGDLTRKIEVRTSDEIRDLGAATNLLLSRLREMMINIRENTVQLTDAARILNRGAEENNKISQEVAEAIQKAAKGAEQQVAQTEEMAVIMEQTMAGLQQVASSTSSAAELAKTTMAIADKGGREVTGNLQNIETLEGALRTIESGISSMVDKSEQVLATTGMITQIAGQTSLLALNASIEAARSGEHGRGFAVVASEIRKLADQSEKASAGIQETVAGMSESVASLVHLVEENAKRIYEGIHSLRGTGEAFQSIVDRVNELSSQMIEVAATVGQMSAGSQSVMNSIQKISRITEDAASAMQEVAAMTEQQTVSMKEIAGVSERVNRMAQSLEEMVQKFKL
jgi:methyl-accepting chemotaxis protein